MSKTNKSILLILLLCLLLSAIFVACDKPSDKDDDYITISFYYTENARPQKVKVKQSELSTFSSGVPTKRYSTFLGFYDSPTGGGIIFDEYGNLVVTLDRDIDVYAQWSVESIQVVFMADGNVIHTELVPYGAIIGAGPTAPDVEGYDFDKWYYPTSTTWLPLELETVLGDDVVISTNSNGEPSVTIKANYTIKSYTVTFDYNDVNFQVRTFNVEHGQYVSGQLLEDMKVEADGKVVTGWSLSSTWDVPCDKPITSDVVLYAQWTKYKIFTLVDHPTNSDYNRTIRLLEGENFEGSDPTREGYEFAGYYTSTLYNGNPLEVISYSLSTTTLYAKWDPISYNITFEANGGTGTIPTDQTYNADTQVELPTDLVKDNCTFVGWCLEQDLSDTPITVLPTGHFGNLTLYAKYKGEDRIVTLDANQGDLYTQAKTVEYGSKYTLPVPSRSGYLFNGWFVDETQITDQDGYSLETWLFPAGEVTAVAKWSQKFYVTVSCQPLGKVYVETNDFYLEGDTVSLNAVAEYGYQVDGFYINDELVYDYANPTFTMPANNVELVLKASPRKITVTLDAGEGACSATSIELTYGEAYTLPVATLRYKSFVGWAVMETTIDWVDRQYFQEIDGTLWASGSDGKGYFANGLVNGYTVKAIYAELDPDAPLQIFEASDFEMMVERPNGNFILIADIDLGGATWTPIAEFSGNLEGAGYTISNFTLSSNMDNLGFFSIVTGSVSNVNFKDVTLNARSTKSYFGVVAGTNKGTITNCTVNGTIESPTAKYVGGIVGYNYNKATLNGCVNYATVTAGEYTGGIAGICVGNIINCTNEGAVKGSSYVGGIAGELSGTAEEIQNKGKITATNVRSGGLIGNFTGTIKDGTNTGVVESTSDYVGGCIGYSKGTASELVNKSAVTGKNYVGGFFGYSESELTGFVNNVTVTGKAYVGGIVGKSTKYLIACENHGSIISSGTVIEDSYSRSYLGGLAGYCGGITSGKNDIDITGTGEKVGGLAGQCTGDVTDCQNDGDVIGKNSTGGLVGYQSGGIIYNSINNGTATGEQYTGGLVGYYSGSKVESSTNNGVVTGENYTGGLIGYAYSGVEVLYSYNTANIKGNYYVGGYVGGARTTSNIRQVINNNQVEGKAYVGGILGSGSSTNLHNCENHGTVLANGTYVDSVAYSYVGGLAGYCSAINDSINTVDITGLGARVGGLAGYCGAINNSTNNGKVVGKDNTGGLGGYVSGSITNGTNNGTVTGEKYTGGLAGYFYGSKLETVKNNGVVAGKDYTAGLVGYAYNGVEVIDADNLADVTGNLYVGGYIGWANSTSNIRQAVNSEKTKVEGKAYVGGIVGHGPSTTLHFCENHGTVVANGTYVDSVAYSYVGGLAGYCATINDSVNTVDIIGLGARVGGLAGYVNGAINNSTNSGKVVGKDYTGGLGGYVNSYIVGSTNNGAVTGEKYSGGLAGYFSGSKLETVKNYGVVTGKDYTAGLVGYSYSGVEVTDSDNFANITGELYVGGYIGYTRTTSNLRQLVNNNTVQGKAYVGGIVGYGSSTTLHYCQNHGAVLATGTYIDSSNVAYSYLGGLAGYCASINNSVNTVDITGLGARVGGLAGYISSGTTTYCNNSGNVTGENKVGGIAGELNGNVADCENSGNVVGNDYVGGLAGYISTSTISAFVNSGSVTGANYVGSIAGYSYSALSATDCQNTANVTGTGEQVASMIGQVRNSTTFRSSKNIGKVNDGYARFIATTAGTINGLINISEATTPYVKVTDTITAQLLGITATNWVYSTQITTVTIAVVSGEQTAGTTMDISATVMDDYGNTDTRYYTISVYGTPTIVCETTSISTNTNPLYIGSTVTFDLNGKAGTAPQSQLVTDEVALVYPTVPTSEGFAFRGWFTEPECTNLYDFSADLKGDITLYAGWETMEESGYYSRVYIDADNVYNSSENAFSITTNNTTSTSAHFVYFTATTGGDYVFNYKVTYGVYAYIINITQNTTIYSELSNSSSYKTISYSANAGDVILFALYKKSSNTTFIFYVTGGNELKQGGTDVIYLGTAAEVLGINALDSFGEELDVQVTLKSGTFEADNQVVYTITATDKVGNTHSIDTQPITVVEPNIQYNPMG